jgi:hypothetical protein
VGHVKESIRRLDTVGTWHNDIAIRVVSAEMLDAVGEHDLARELVAAACARIEALAAAIDDADLRASFLQNVRENARARAWLAAGRRPPA